MGSRDRGVYTKIFGALKHDVRREVLLRLSRRRMSFTELYETIGISSSHLNYHLLALDGLITKRDTKYGLSRTGETAVTMFSDYTAPKRERPRVNVFFKYCTAILFFLFVALTSSLVHEFDVSAEIVKMGIVDAFILIVYTNWPVIIFAFMKAYYSSPLNESITPFGGHLNTENIT